MSRAHIRWCRHYQRPEPMTDKCAVGLDPRGGEAFGGGPPGGFYRMPCHDSVSDTAGDKRTCPSVDFFSDAEVAQQDRETEEWTAKAVARINKTWPVVETIKAKFAGRDASGVEVCPVCGGKLQWRHAGYNGHVAMSCEMDDCVRFME